MVSDLNLQTFEAIFKENYHLLLLTAFQIVKDENVAKDVVQEFFIDFWEKRNSRGQVANFQAYAVRSVKNLSVSCLRRNISEEVKFDNYQHTVEDDVQLDIIALEEELKKHQHNEARITEVLSLLPEKRRQIFLSYVVDELSYEQIAEKYGVSVNTVKTQMQRTYKFLKSHLADNSLNSILLAVLLHNI